MNPRERVMTALARREPDRVPILEWSIHPKVYKALCPDAADQHEFEVAMGLDALCPVVTFNPVKVNPDGSYLDEWGVLYGAGPETVDHPLRGPIQTKDDLKKFVPPNPEAPHRLGKLPELVAKYKGQKALIIRHRAAFMWSVFLHGFENMLVDFLADPEFVHELMDRVLEANIRVARNAVRAGADALCIADDYAGNDAPFFSPAIAREFVIPRLKRMVDAIHEEGGKVIKHSDGNLWPILDQIVAAGVDAVNPLEPIARMDIGEVKQKYGDQVAVIGNIDCGHLLPYGSREEVEAAVRECIRKAGRGGGLIISSSNSIHSSVKPENYRVMIEATHKYGRYPLLTDEA
jgi:uroporphyrinogen decarboxylase